MWNSYKNNSFKLASESHIKFSIFHKFHYLSAKKQIKLTLSVEVQKAVIQ